jgi:hypothetical protein
MNLIAQRACPAPGCCRCRCPGLHCVIDRRVRACRRHAACEEGPLVQIEYLHKDAGPGEIESLAFGNRPREQSL